MTTTPKYSFILNKGTKMQSTNLESIIKLKKLIVDIESVGDRMTQRHKDNISGLKRVVKSLMNSKTAEEHFANMKDENYK